MEALERRPLVCPKSEELELATVSFRIIETGHSDVDSTTALRLSKLLKSRLNRIVLARLQYLAGKTDRRVSRESEM